MSFLPMKKKTIDNNTIDTTTTWSSSKILDMIYPIGSIIQSTTLNTMAKVKAQYGGNTWIQHSGYVLRGATSGVVANSAAKTGGADTHTLTNNQLPKLTGSIGFQAANTVYSSETGGITGSGVFSTNNTSFNHRNMTSGSGVVGTSMTTVNFSIGNGESHNNLPSYKSVYIWERTA